jgi:DNA-binding CsgD family transcriptional regulator
MAKLNRKRTNFVEIMMDRLIIESFSNEKSAYHQGDSDSIHQERTDKLRDKIIWHINHTLSVRQKEVLKLYLMGKKEAEIARILGIKQQVVNIYKKRAVNRLREVVDNDAVC